MKKSYVFLGVVLIVLGLFIVACVSSQNDKVLSDDELVRIHLNEEYGEGNYDINIQDSPNEDEIYYIVYENGKFFDLGHINRNDILYGTLAR